MAIDTNRGNFLEKDYPIKPVPMTDVHFTDTFWRGRIDTNRKATIPYCFDRCEDTGRVANFEIAAGTKEGEHKGDFPFDDTDIYKTIEGASYTLLVQPDEKLDAYMDGLIAKVAGAQEEDGYLYTPRTNKSEHLFDWYKSERWINLGRSHELYNCGHLYEAAVAHYMATGKRSLLDVAIKSANLIDSVFGPGKNPTPPGHQIVEMALVKLYRVTGEERYLNLAKWFLDCRGKARKVVKDGVEQDELWGEYAQDHKPVLEQDDAVGHAVRAAYQYAGMADVAALTGDHSYVDAIDKLWENVVTKKLYVTGGIGSRGDGECFGDNYELPNVSAYCETCAAIGNVYWNHRLFLLHGEAKYVDVLERTLYNGLISGVSLDGKEFFYPNPLASLGQHARSPWFGCSCCPVNVARFMASLPGYAYAHDEDRLYVNLYISGKADIPMEGGDVQITQQTDYPWHGNIEVKVDPVATREFKVYLRIPGWARNEAVPSDLYRFVDTDESKYTLKINKENVSVELVDGYAVVSRTWQPGDVIELDLPMPIRRIIANDKVVDDRGLVALQRGPIVYCAEWPDNKGGKIRNIVVTDDADLRAECRPDMFDGVCTITGTALGARLDDLSAPVVLEEQDLLAIPYYAWAHRGRGQMSVWLARTPEAAKPLTPPTIASTAIPTTSQELDASIVCEPYDPESSSDKNVGFFHWWPRLGTKEWIEFELEKPEKVSKVAFYWFDDGPHGGCRVPQSWELFYKEGEDWKPVQSASQGGCEKDTYNWMIFDAVETKGIKVEVQFQPDFAGGIIRWKVE